MSFDWQTEEDVDWEDPITPKEEVEKQAKRRRRWPWAVIVMVVLFFTAVFVIARTVYQRVEVATENVEDELLASVTVIHNAAADADVELFTTFLSGKDSGWAEDSEFLVGNGMYFDRQPFGLHWVEVDPQTAVISTTLSPELKRAEVLSEYQYEFSVGDGISDTITLQQTAVYRLGPNRWLLAPPEEEAFWGEASSLESRFFTLRYPARDEQIVQRLAADLEVELAGYCALLGEDCPEDFHLNILFSAAPAYLASDVGYLRENEGELEIVLATPSLVGLPKSRKGYEALYRGYATQLFVPLLQATYENGCCGHLFVDALIPHLLSQMGVWREGDTAVNWNSLATNHTQLRHFNGNWDGAGVLLEPQDYELVKASLQFLIEEVNIPPIEILQTLHQSTEETFFSFLITHFGDRYSTNHEVWEREWRQFILEQAEQTELTTPLPEQDLLMLCQPDWAVKVALYRHDFATGFNSCSNKILSTAYNWRCDD